MEGGELTVFIVDSSRFLRERLADALDAIAGLEVVGQAGTARDAVAGIERLQPELVLLELQLEGGSGLEVLGHIKRKALPVRVIVLTGSTDPKARARSLDLGAELYLEKSQGAEPLVQALRDMAGPAP